MPQFFIKSENVQDDLIFITDMSDINHISNVLRYEQGDKLTLSEQSGHLYQVEILAIKLDLIETKIISKENSDKALKTNIVLAQSILKSQKQDLVIQKAVELGVNQIIPFISKNTVVKFESEKDKKHKVDRWQKIANEASKQCERVSLPEVRQIISFNELMALTDFDVRFVCVERNAENTIKSFLRENQKKDNVLVIIGPEGGWDKSELNKFNEYNVNQVSLGNLILRAETAAIMAISDVIYEYEL